jgi:threonylcarbamoyladenosine tRNA methylthiotransferase MtaB
VFPFSARDGTPAARMPQVPKPVIKERAAMLRLKGAAVLAGRLQSLIGTEQTILVEKPGMGRTACFAPVELNENAAPGGFARARITDSSGKHLVAQLQ